MRREAWARWRVFRAAVRRLRLPLLALAGVVSAGTLSLWLEGGEPNLGHSLLYVLNLITFQREGCTSWNPRRTPPRPSLPKAW
jgi:hypothetical protein